MQTVDQQNMQNAMYDIAIRKLGDIEDLCHDLSLDIECNEMSAETKQALQAVNNQIYKILFPAM
jgi:hypothetical protein